MFPNSRFGGSVVTKEKNVGFLRYLCKMAKRPLDFFNESFRPYRAWNQVSTKEEQSSA